MDEDEQAAWTQAAAEAFWRMEEEMEKPDIFVKIVKQTWTAGDPEPLIEEFHLTIHEFIVKLLLPEMEKISGNSSKLAEHLASTQEAGGSNPPSRTSPYKPRKTPRSK